ncbi:MAG: IS1634 family transposase [Alphaproteobacteria bacterium]|nr:IS1634 family transposase [Alphaproteobacteria bacterium]
MIPSDLDILARPVAHLPFVRAVVDQLGLLEHIEERCPTHKLNRVSDAQCVLALVLNVLCGRPALYRMNEWLARLDTDVLFGEGVPADAFNDTRLAEALDHLDEAGTDTVLADIVRAYLAEEGEPRAFSAHHDTTSVVLQGAYEMEAEPRPAHGYSKDHRPDLKQLIYGLTLHGSTGIPLVSTVSAGNTSDPTVARDHLARLVEVLPDEHEVTLVGDCKLVDARTVGRLFRAGLHFLSLVPDTFNVRQELIREAWATNPNAEDWPLLAEKKGRKKDDPTTAYRGRSFVRPFKTILETADGDDGTTSFEELRFLVVWSDDLASGFDDALEPKLVRDEGKLREAAKRANGRGFACEADARTAAERVASKAEFHRATIELVSEDVPIKRAGPGRPKKDDVRETRAVWKFELTLERDEELIAATRRRRSCFVLVTDWHAEDWDDARVLAEYRHQHLVEGHTGFRWLKGPAAVAPVFLKTPERIRAMGLVLVLALMVRNYIQTTLRSELKARGETLVHPFTKKKETSLTPEMAFEHFGGLLTQVLTLGEHTRRTPVRLSDPAIQILSLFALDAAIFTPPPPIGTRKWRRRSKQTPGM